MPVNLYRLKDLTGKSLKGVFYEQQLYKVVLPVRKTVEKVWKRDKKGNVFVSFLDHPKKTFSVVIDVLQTHFCSRDILDDDLRIWILSNDQRVQRKSKIDSVRSFFEARLERVLNLTENKWKLCVDKVILNNEQDDRLYVKLEDPNGGFERSIDLPGGHYTNSFEIVQEVDTLLRNRSFVDPLKLHKKDQYKFGVFFGFNNKQWCFKRGSIMLKLHGDEDYCTLWQKIVKAYNDKVFFVGKDGKKYLRRYDLKKNGHNIFRDKYLVHELAGEKAGLSDSVWKDVLYSNSLPRSNEYKTFVM